MPTKARIVGVDLVRSVAIFGAMGSHALHSAGAFADNDSAGMTVARLAMGVSTPVFICLFGSMLEIVYRPRLSANGPKLTTQKLLSRALQCYVLYILALFLRVALGDFSVGYALRCALLIGVTPYSDILKFYALVLTGAPLLLWIATRRFGLLALCIGAFAIHALHPLLPLISVPSPEVLGNNFLNFAAGFFYGGGVGPGGPSLVHGVTLVIYGIVVGKLALLLLEADQRSRWTARLGFLGCFSTLLGLAVLQWPWGMDINVPVQRLIDMTYRNGNYPIYFLIGSACSTIMVWVSLEVYDIYELTWGRRLSFIGSSSLFTFSFGNMLVVASPRPNLDPTTAIMYGLALLAAVFTLTWLFWSSLKHGRTQLKQGHNGSLAKWARFQGAIIEGLFSVLGPLAKWYSSILWQKPSLTK